MDRPFNRRDVIKGIAASGTAMMLAGCGGGGNGNGNGNGNGDNGMNVGMVYSTGGLGDNSFNDMAHQGIQAAQEEYDLSYDNTEPESPSEFNTFQRQFASSTNPNYNLVVTVGFSQKSALQEVAPQFSDQKFTIIDEAVDQPNVESYVFKEHEGSFQAGVLAALLTSRDVTIGAGSTNPDEKVVGFVGGKRTPLIEKFEAGFKFGVQQVDEDVEVRAAYAGAWSDPGKGKSIANSMMDGGADVLYHAAGGSGAGMIEAAQSRGRLAIGVDARQSETLSEYADVILGSMLKQVDQAVLETVSNVANDEFAGGETITLGLAEEGAKLVYGSEIGDDIPQEIKDEIETRSQEVTNGNLTVPSSLDGL